jgi:hypothetical protein
MSKYQWKVWLRNNKLTDNPSDYIAEVDVAGNTRRQQDIIDRVVAEGSEVSAATIKAVIDRVNAVKQDFILSGYSVFDDFIHLTPRVTGSWEGTEKFTDGKHRITVDAVLSKEMHAELKEVGVHVLGIADSGVRIMLVTDVATGKTDGNVTPGDDIVIAGDKIKIAGLPQPDGSLEPGINAYFVATNGEAAPALRISENRPSRIVARVPALDEGNYTLRIVTRYTRGSALLKEPRTVEYSLPILISPVNGGGA